MNRSLAGVVQEVLEHTGIGEILGAVHGLDGIMTDNLLDLRRVPAATWKRVSRSPGAALGSGRRRLSPVEGPRLLETLNTHRIGYLFTIGGNDTAETAHQVAQDTNIAVVHIPKTVDNDLVATDHCPGFGSAARFVALATMGVGMDTQAMGVDAPLAVIEVMGRDAGWLAASAVLAKRDESDAPHFVGIPEVPMKEDGFLSTMEVAYRRWGFAVAVVAENVRGNGGPLGGQRDPYHVDEFGHEYFEGPGRYLAHTLSRHLGARVRSEKPGVIQRSLTSCVSHTDAAEAEMAGRAAVRYAMAGRTDCMVTLVREPGPGYRCTAGLAPLRKVAGAVRPLPWEYIDTDIGLPSAAFARYARPLLGSPLPRVAGLLALQAIDHS